MQWLLNIFKIYSQIKIKRHYKKCCFFSIFVICAKNINKMFDRWIDISLDLPALYIHSRSLIFIVLFWYQPFTSESQDMYEFTEKLLSLLIELSFDSYFIHTYVEVFSDFRPTLNSDYFILDLGRGHFFQNHPCFKNSCKISREIQKLPNSSRITFAWKTSARGIMNNHRS